MNIITLDDLREHLQWAIELDLPQAISVLEEDCQASASWVTGGVPVTRSDGTPLETRNRVTLCRCGQSANKPLATTTTRLAIDATQTARAHRETRVSPGVRGKLSCQPPGRW